MEGEILAIIGNLETDICTWRGVGILLEVENVVPGRSCGDVRNLCRGVTMW